MSKSRQVLLFILVVVFSLGITFLTLAKTSPQSRPAFKPTPCSPQPSLGVCGTANDPTIQGTAEGYPFMYYFVPQSSQASYSLKIAWNYGYFALDCLIYIALVGSLTIFASSVSKAK
jgi:hypothetical protein